MRAHLLKCSGAPAAWRAAGELLELLEAAGELLEVLQLGPAGELLELLPAAAGTVRGHLEAERLRGVMTTCETGGGPEECPPAGRHWEWIMATRMQLQHYRRIAREAEELRALEAGTGARELVELRELLEAAGPATVPELVEVAGGWAHLEAGRVVDVTPYADPWGCGR